MVVGEQGLFLFVRIVRRNNQPHLIYITVFKNMIGNNQMANMNGIK